jgi:membrane-associated phospholipid phosphatase
MSLWHDLSWVLPLRHPTLTAVFEAFTLAGYPLFYLALLPLVYWLWKPRESHQLVAFLILSALLNSFLKDFFDDPRPDVAFALDGRVGGSYGFPSGHAQLAVVTWGALAIFAGTRAATVGAVVMIVGICLSRLYLGVHDIEDVVGGLTLGGLSLLLFARYREALTAQWASLSWLPQGALLLAPLGLLPLLWPEPDGPGGVLGLSAYLFGWWLGHRLTPEADPLRPALQGGRGWPLAAVALAGLFLGLSQISTGLEALGLGEGLSALLEITVMGAYVTALAGGGRWLQRR